MINDIIKSLNLDKKVYNNGASAWHPLHGLQYAKHARLALLLNDYTSALPSLRMQIEILSVCYGATNFLVEEAKQTLGI